MKKMSEDGDECEKEMSVDERWRDLKIWMKNECTEIYIESERKKFRVKRFKLKIIYEW